MKEDPMTETAATGSLGPVMVNLAALLGSEYKLRRRTRRDVKFIKSKFKAMHSLLWDAWEREVPDAVSKELKIEALVLADEMDDAVDDFMLTMEPSRRSKRLIQTKNKANPFEDFKRRANDVSGRCRSKWKKKTAQPICSNLFPRNKPVVKPTPRAHPFVRKDASELVGLDEPKNNLIKFLLGEDAEGTMVETPVERELKPKMASILGMAGMGKTTLADLVYEEIGNKFGARAFVSVTPGGNMKEFLAEILEQVTADNTSPPAATKAATEEHHLIDQISDFLKDKRYLVIIDDVWHWDEWEIIFKSLPQNELGSRVVTTTRINAVAEKWRDDCNAFFYKMHPHFDCEDRYVYRIGSTEDVGAQIIAINADMAGEDFNYEHPVVRMCGGMPLAVVCMLSAVRKEREKQAEQGLDATTPDVQDMIEEQVMRHGIQNTPGFEPLVESLQLGYSDLPHHMLKSCLLYCTSYPDQAGFWSRGLVKEWMAERFILEEETGKSYYAELFSRGLIFDMKNENNIGFYSRIHPMMLNFLRWKSREDNFITFSSDIQSASPIRRLCIDSWPSSDAVDHLSGIDWSPIRSLVVHNNAERVPYKHLQRLRVLDVQHNHALANGHLKDMCGLTRMRHLFGELGSGITEIPSDVAKLQRLETLEVRDTRISELPGVIGALQQLKTLTVFNNGELKVLPRELGDLQELITLDIRFCYDLAELPSEICDLKKLRNLCARFTGVTEVPKEIWKLQQLKSLDMGETLITELPKEIMKLQNLEQLELTGSEVQKIPWKSGGLKKLKTLDIDYSIITLPLEVCQISELVKLPECIHQARNDTCVWSSLARENLSFRSKEQHLWMAHDEGGLVVGANQIRIPSWIKDHFNDLQVLDIRVCKVEEEGLKILREMPRLRNLTLRFAAVPEEPLVIRGEGFASLFSLCVDSPVPRVSFQEGAMPSLEELMFQIQFYGGPPNKSPLGMSHLCSLRCVNIEYNKDWYKADRRGIRGTIEALILEALLHSNSILRYINKKYVDDEKDEEGEDKKECRWWRDQAYLEDVRCWRHKSYWEDKGDGDDEEEGRWWRDKAYWVKEASSDKCEDEEEGSRDKGDDEEEEGSRDKGDDEEEEDGSRDKGNDDEEDGRWCSEKGAEEEEEVSSETGEIEESQA